MKLCLGCMKMIEDNRWNCPNCGFDEKIYRPDPACLPIGTVLGGKYIVGKCQNLTSDTISYLGWDAEQEKKLVIEEFFPRKYSFRDPGETEIGVYAGEAVDLFQKRLDEFLSVDTAIVLRENKTGYRLNLQLEERVPNKKKSGLRGGMIASAVGAVIVVGILGWALFFRNNDNPGSTVPENTPSVVAEQTAAVAKAVPEPEQTVSPTVTPEPEPTESSTVTPEPEPTESSTETPKSKKKSKSKTKNKKRSKKAEATMKPSAKPGGEK